MGPAACGKTKLPDEGSKPQPAADDDWKELLTASNVQSAAPALQERGQPSSGMFQDLAPEPQDEPYDLLDEYVDDLLGIPIEERTTSQRPSWQATSPQIVLEDGSRAPATAPTAGAKPSTPYLAGVINEWATIDKKQKPLGTLEPTETRDGPAPKRRVEKPP